MTEAARHGQVWQACHKISKCESAKKPKVGRTRLEICHIWNPSSFTTRDEETWRTQPQFSTTCYECIKSDFQKAPFNDSMAIITQASAQRGVEYVRSTSSGLLVAVGCGWRAPMSAYNHSIFMNHSRWNYQWECVHISFILARPREVFSVRRGSMWILTHPSPMYYCTIHIRFDSSEVGRWNYQQLGCHCKLLGGSW